MPELAPTLTHSQQSAKRVCIHCGGPCSISRVKCNSCWGKIRRASRTPEQVATENAAARERAREWDLAHPDRRLEFQENHAAKRRSLRGEGCWRCHLTGAWSVCPICVEELSNVV